MAGFITLDIHPLSPVQMGPTDSILSLQATPENRDMSVAPQLPLRPLPVHPLDYDPAGSKSPGRSAEKAPSSSAVITQSSSTKSRSDVGRPSSAESSIHPLDPATTRVSQTEVNSKNLAISVAPDHVVSTADSTPSTTCVLQPGRVNVQKERETITQHPSKITKESPRKPSSHRQLSSAPSLQSGPAQLSAVNLQLPITRDTLRELDLFEIFKNPQLRHDIVFDPHLQFRPNFDGERGLVKRREADRFWREVGVELNTRRAVLAARREAAATMLSLAGLSANSPSNRLIQQQAQQMCPLPKAVLLPRLIDELREILLSLLPPAPPAQAPAPSQDGSKASQGQMTLPISPERALLMSTLDPDLLLQELDHGVLDVYALFRFLGDSLKGHCAPMRDALVESMVSIVVDSEEIVRGIRMCFEILEWMKLDIANHQLRTLRPWLLDNSIDFEQKYFTELLARGGTIHRTREWFKRTWIQWENVKQSVLGKSTAAPSQTSHRSSLIPPSLPPPTFAQKEAERGATSSKPSLTTKRRGSFVCADIGENILDGVVNEGLLEMILHPHGAIHTMPETFELDHYRLVTFHNDFQDLTILCTLLILFRQLAQNCWTQQDLVEIKKVVWLLLTDENANFGANTNNINQPSRGSTSVKAGQTEKTGGSSGMKDIVIQIEFAARKVRERSKPPATAAAAASTTTGATEMTGPQRSSLAAAETPLPTFLAGHRRRNSLTTLQGSPAVRSMDAVWSTVTPSSPSLALTTSPIAAIAPTPGSAFISGLSTSNTNLLTAWLDNALCRTSTLYKLIQKRLLIHFRRWLYLHSSASMLVLSASCASLASAISMSSSAEGIAKAEEDEEEDSFAEESKGIATDSNSKQQIRDDTTGNGDGNGISLSTMSSTSITGQPSKEGVTPTPLPIPTSGASPTVLAPSSNNTAAPSPTISPEEANKAAAEALAAKLSFDPAEMDAHGLTGLEDEMTALLEKIRAVSEFNKKVYGSWYRDLVKEGRAENWLDSKVALLESS
ncbi:hypothetical protein BGX28_006488 [Mortierella sp. GBA30]|nr:hypothetical protein BGX28_006488 [Mortierella sp. GBA30]